MVALALILLILVIAANFYVEQAFQKLLIYVPIEALLAADEQWRIAELRLRKFLNVK